MAQVSPHLYSKNILCFESLLSFVVIMYIQRILFDIPISGGFLGFV